MSFVVVGETGGHNRRQVAEEAGVGNRKVASGTLTCWMSRHGFFVSLSAQISLSPGIMAVALTILRAQE